MVLDIWCGDFKGLYNQDSDQDNFDKTSSRKVIVEKNRLKAEMSQPSYVSNPALNNEISYHEIKRVLQT